MKKMDKLHIVIKREFHAYFSTPIALIFICIFLALTGAFAFYIGGFFARGRADLDAFFSYHPWLYLMLVPAIAMRLWAEERKTGTIELLLTLPISTGQAVFGKFIAAWMFCGISLFLTFPMWITVNVLGNPDNGVVFAAYLGSFIISGAFLSIGACVSAMTKNQVIAFILAAVICFLFAMSGVELVLNFFRSWAPDPVIQVISQMSFLTHFSEMMRGIIDLHHLFFFGSLIAFFLFLNIIIVELKKGS